MLPLVRRSLSGQFAAALTMLDRCVRACPDDLWNRKVGQFPFWHVAYHVLFYTDLYLSRSEGEFRPQKWNQAESQILGSTPWPPFKKVVVKRPYDKAALRKYVAVCMTKTSREIARETTRSLAGDSGFEWIPFPRLELHFYNIRHIQHHTGQLGAFLRKHKVRGVNWVGTKATSR